MKDNSQNRTHEVFFYGLYMNPQILEQKNVVPRNPRKAWVDGYELRIGNKATLLRSDSSVTKGMVYSLTHDEINFLYWGAGLNEYAAEALLVKTDEGTFPALCCNLINPPGEEESNQEYEKKLQLTLRKLGIE